MSRARGRTALILGEQDALDLSASVTAMIDKCERGGMMAGGQERAELLRLYRLRRRLDAAASRIQCRRNGRSAAAA